MEWQGLNLYLPLDRLDPALREALAGKRIGDKFGPVSLGNGVIVAGSLTEIAGDIDITNSKEFVAYAATLTALQKADQSVEFKKMMDSSFAANPVVKRLWGEILGIGGTVIGGMFGAPQIGGAVGAAVGGYFDNSNSRPPPPPSPSFNPGQWRQQVPQMVNNYPSVPLPPPPMNHLPGMFNNMGAPIPQFIPPMPPQYHGGWVPQFPPPPLPPFIPPFAMPMMCRYF